LAELAELAELPEYLLILLDNAIGISSFYLSIIIIVRALSVLFEFLVLYILNLYRKEHFIYLCFVSFIYQVIFLMVFGLSFGYITVYLSAVIDDFIFFLTSQKNAIIPNIDRDFLEFRFKFVENDFLADVSIKDIRHTYGENPRVSKGSKGEVVSGGSGQPGGSFPKF